MKIFNPEAIQYDILPGMTPLTPPLGFGVSPSRLGIK
jgi:hypothetical protein